VINANCNQKGSAVIQTTGGVPTYTYSLNGGSYQASGSFNNLNAGTYKVAVKDNAGCVFEVSFEIRQAGNIPNLVIANQPKICLGSTANLQDTSIVRGSDRGLVYTYWRDTSAGLSVANPGAVTAGTYYIKATNDEGCTAIKPVVVTVHTSNAGRITVTGSASVCAGNTVTLTASTGSAYQWFRNDTAISGATTAVYRATVAGFYSVAINDGTCMALASNTVRVQFLSCIINPETNVFVPTGFTPNKNGANDVLRPLLYNIASLNYFKVYNRWGQLVFQTNEMGKGWNGTINGVQQPTETYTWLLECTDNDGNVIKKSGRSLLIR
jgi:gliding motility-associated-like protein